MLMSWSISRDKETAKRLESFIETQPTRIHKSLEDLKLKDPADIEQVRELDVRISMCLRNLGRAFNERGQVVGIQRVAELVQFLQFEIEPQMVEIRRLHDRIMSRHEALARTSNGKEIELKHRVWAVLWILLLVNCLTASALAFGFIRGIIGRLSVISENISRFWRRDPLLEPLPGADEISSVDECFHDMARALGEAGERERSILENMPVGLISCSEEQTIEAVNPKMSQLLSGSSQLLLGKSIGELIQEPDFSFETLLHADLPRTWRVQSTSGEFPAELSISRFRQAGRTKYLLGVVDVTARNEVERLKQEFLSVVSHDLRTPLTAIQLSAEVISLDQDNLSQSSQRAVTIIRRDCDRLLRLTKDLLDVARLESGNVRLEKETVEVSSVIEAALDAVAATAEAKGVELNSSPADFSVFCDSDRIIQILVNLLSNAIKFSQSGQTVSIKATEYDTEIEFKVADEGRGISQTEQELIFERFKQVNSDDAKRGSGLGLAICKMLVEAHGGSIGVDSEQNRGSRFWFRIPRVT
ncbi:MAG: PAS domain S-box protein [Cyanobacteria bacterium]|nr:PAS domain S-box protein [Cyanobacteriota bacterium]